MDRNFFQKIIKLDKAEKSGLINAIIKPISLVLTLAYTPLLLDYLGNEKYGLWATILSVISWINYFDVGIGNGLEKKNHEHAKKAVSTAYVILTIISSIILLVLVASCFFIDWKNVFSTNIDLRPTLIISFVSICINFVLSLANVILYALQLSELVAIRGCFVQLLNFFGLLVLSKIETGNLVYLAILFGSTSIIINIVNTIQIITKRQFLKPNISSFSKECVPEICNTGLQFFVIQIMCLLMFTVDDMLITHFFGAELVTPFSIVNRVYNTGYSFLAAFLVPYWSGTTAAIARNEISWIKKSIIKTSKLLTVFIIGCILVALIFEPAVKIWLRKDLDYQTGIIPLMCIFYILYAILAVECQFINGSGRLKVQLVMYIILGIVNVPFSILIGVSLGLKTVGIRLATTILVFIADIVLGFNLRSTIKKLEKEAGNNKKSSN